MLLGAAVLAGGLHACGVFAPGVRRLSSGQCKPGRPLAGVYLSFRLKVIDRCVTVHGTVDCVRTEPDGDTHVELLLARRYRRLLRPANALQRCAGHLQAHLVVEIIPQTGHLPFLTNSAARGGFVTPAAPAVGDQVTVTGPYVLDTNPFHEALYANASGSNWAEIHPAWNITVNHRAPARPHHQHSRHPG